jgi:hypothetical protein
MEYLSRLSDYLFSIGEIEKAVGLSVCAIVSQSSSGACDADTPMESVKLN